MLGEVERYGPCDLIQYPPDTAGPKPSLHKLLNEFAHIAALHTLNRLVTHHRNEVIECPRCVVFEALVVAGWVGAKVELQDIAEAFRTRQHVYLEHVQHGGMRGATACSLEQVNGGSYQVSGRNLILVGCCFHINGP
ncbi:hypothetical protein [Burkholderia cenocepacia]|uniref:hypothetical protein n=1 Tax=Burkholderia cenocepacia TaxID=95486 RepID=UPI0021AB86CD|nr:hypothetical protein [Burkholderia cenocepacia]